MRNHRDKEKFGNSLGKGEREVGGVLYCRGGTCGSSIKQKDNQLVRTMEAKTEGRGRATLVQEKMTSSLICTEAKQEMSTVERGDQGRGKKAA